MIVNIEGSIDAESSFFGRLSAPGETFEAEGTGGNIIIAPGEGVGGFIVDYEEED
jgi:hypothetical protein